MNYGELENRASFQTALMPNDPFQSPLCSRGINWTPGTTLRHRPCCVIDRTLRGCLHDNGATFISGRDEKLHRVYIKSCYDLIRYAQTNVNYFPLK